jgi:hypothetical protein
MTGGLCRIGRHRGSSPCPRNDHESLDRPVEPELIDPTTSAARSAFASSGNLAEQLGHALAEE